MSEVATQPFPHPETGAPLSTLHEFQDALTDVETRLGELYRVRAPLREEMTQRFEAVLPTNPRNRTLTQAMVARCPRCRTEIPDE